MTFRPIDIDANPWEDHCAAYTNIFWRFVSNPDPSAKLPYITTYQEPHRFGLEAITILSNMLGKDDMYRFFMEICMRKPFDTCSAADWHMFESLYQRALNLSDSDRKVIEDMAKRDGSWEAVGYAASFWYCRRAAAQGFRPYSKL